MAIFLRPVAQAARPSGENRRNPGVYLGVRNPAGEFVNFVSDVQFQGGGAGGRGANSRGIEVGEHDARSDRIRGGDSRPMDRSFCIM